jgi:hypothetical protein
MHRTKPQSDKSAALLYPPIHEEFRPVVGTRQAAFYLLRGEQTLRQWAAQDKGPIRPVKVGHLLGWPMADIRRLVGVEG